jgi:hypothetical protein
MPRQGWLRRIWSELKTGMPGSRFLDHYQRRQHHRSGRLMRTVLIGAGASLIVLGSIMLLTPGPGAVVLLLGALIVASESRSAARALDRCEIQIRASLRRLRRRA